MLLEQYRCATIVKVSLKQQDRDIFQIMVGVHSTIGQFYHERHYMHDYAKQFLSPYF